MKQSAVLRILFGLFILPATGFTQTVVENWRVTAGYQESLLGVAPDASDFFDPGDLDGDGAADILVPTSIFDARSRPALDGWRLRAFSGRTLSLLWETTDDENRSPIFRPVGDADCDGIGDIGVLLLQAIPTNAQKASLRRYMSVFSGRSGVRLQTLRPSDLSFRDIAAVAPVGDFDQDGCVDYAVADSSVRGGRGAVKILSSRDRKVLRTFVGPRSPFLGGGGGFGFSMVALGDLNGDGVFELVVGAPLMGFTRSAQGAAYLLDPRFGRIVHTAKGKRVAGKLGERLLLLPDIDGDRTNDLYIFGSTWYSGRTMRRLGVMRSIAKAVGEPQLWDNVYFPLGDLNADGRTEFAIRTSREAEVAPIQVRATDGTGVPRALPRAGQSVRLLGDVNADGIADLVILNALGRYENSLRAQAWVISGQDGTELGALLGARSSFSALGSVFEIADVDGDGNADVVVGDPLASDPLFANGTVTAYSGADGAVLFRAAGHASCAGFGSHVARVRDTNHDSIDDFVVGSFGPRSSGDFSPYTVLECEDTPRSVPRITLLSGLTGAELWHLDAPNGGSGLVRLGDLDRDGSDDVLFPGGTYFPPFDGSPFNGPTIFSSLTGSVLHTQQSFWVSGDPFRKYLAAVVGDGNGDGVLDLLIGSWNRAGGDAGFIGATFVWDTPSSQVHYRETGLRISPFAPADGPFWYFGRISDFTQDGVDEIVAGPATTSNMQTSALNVYDGRTGEILQSIEDRKAQFSFHYDLGSKSTDIMSLGDFNQDGIADIAFGGRAAWHRTRGTPYDNSLVVISPANGAKLATIPLFRGESTPATRFSSFGEHVGSVGPGFFANIPLEQGTGGIASFSIQR